jgi:hypothetical protein
MQEITVPIVAVAHCGFSISIVEFLFFPLTASLAPVLVHAGHVHTPVAALPTIPFGFQAPPHPFTAS